MPAWSSPTSTPTRRPRPRPKPSNRGAAEAGLAIGDLTADGAGERAVAALLDRWGGIDVLVNNAGWSVPGFIAEDTDRAKWQRTVEVNFYTAVACTQAAIPPMRPAWRRRQIEFIASDAAFGQILPAQGIYGATKAALIALARTTAREHGRHGIRANVVCPGLVLPDSPDAVGSASLWAVGQDAVFSEKQIDYLKKDIPLRRLTTAEDIANTVTWISSARAARQITGQVLSVSGEDMMPLSGALSPTLIMRAAFGPSTGRARAPGEWRDLTHVGVTLPAHPQGTPLVLRQSVGDRVKLIVGAVHRRVPRRPGRQPRSACAGTDVDDERVGPIGDLLEVIGEPEGSVLLVELEHPQGQRVPHPSFGADQS